MKNIKLLFVVLLSIAIVFGFSMVFAKSENANENAKGQNQNQNQSSMGDEHRSTVANFVQNLLKVASRSEGGIGEQVRVIAQEQNDSNENEADAIESIQKRNKIKTFLIGTNYKNLGKLRSNMVQVRNRIEKLNRLMEQIKNTEIKTELQNRIQELGQERTRIEEFLKANESKFSLFGWFVKLFNK